MKGIDTIRREMVQMVVIWTGLTAYEDFCGWLYIVMVLFLWSYTNFKTTLILDINLIRYLRRIAKVPLPLIAPLETTTLSRDAKKYNLLNIPRSIPSTWGITSRRAPE